MESEFKVTHLYCEGLPPEASRSTGARPDGMEHCHPCGRRTAWTE